MLRRLALLVATVGAVLERPPRRLVKPAAADREAALLEAGRGACPVLCVDALLPYQRLPLAFDDATLTELLEDIVDIGVQYSVREFVTRAAACLDIHLDWQGSGLNETAVDQNGQTVVAVDSLYYRPAEVETLLGDPSKAMNELGWKPTVAFDDLVKEMVESDFLLEKKKHAADLVT